MCDTLLSVHVALRNERDALLRREYLLQNWRQPAVRLPAEILQVIFEMACVATVQEDEASDWARQYRCTQNAINLTCSRWRQLALNATGLWSHIFVYHRPHPEAARAPLRNLIHTELERAGGRPLALYLFNDVDTESSYEWNSSMDMISPELHRCVAYDAVLQPFMPFETFSSPLFLPSLRALVLTWCYDDDSSPDIPAKSVRIDLTNAPSLRDLRLRYQRPMDPSRADDPPRLFFKVPTPCFITELHVSEDVDHCSVVDAINSCPRLEILELDVCASALDDRPLTIAPLLFLVNLSVNLEQSAIMNCVSALSAPNLTQLRLQCENHVDQQIWDTLNSIFAASRFPALRYLEVEGTRSRFWHMLPLFIASHPNLVEVMVNECHYLDEELCNSMSGLPASYARPLHLTIWLALKHKRQRGGKYPLDTQWLRKLLSARVQTAAQCPNPSTFVVKMDPRWTEYRSKDLSVYPEVAKLTRMYSSGHVIFSTGKYRGVPWHWEWYEPKF